MTGPILETERLILHPPRREDFEAFAAMMQDGDALRFIGGAQPRTAAWRSFCSMAGAWSLFGFSMFSVIEKASGAWIGRLGPLQPEGWPGTEIGWGLIRDAWGKGYATEGAAAAADWAFEHLGWSDIIHCIDPANLASQAVARRLGSRFLRVGEMPPPYDGSPIDIWGQSREDWLSRRP